jgi:MFS family permease
VTPAGLSLLTTSFPEGPLRDKALGLNGALMSAGFTTGAILGGVLTDVLSWRYAFFINVPIAFGVLLVAPSVIKESRPETRPRLDAPGAITVTLGLLSLVYGLTQAGQHGWGSPAALLTLLLGIALLLVFYAVESRATAPLVPVSILKRRTVIWGNVAGLIAFLTETSLVFLMTLYLQDVLDFSALAAGLSFGVLGLGTVVGGSTAARMIARTGTRSTLVIGGLVQAAATASLLMLGQSHSSLWLLLPATCVGGVGNMFVIVGFMVTATSGLPDHEQGMATGLATMTQQIGITMGTPIMSSIVATQAGAHTSAHSVLDGVALAVLVNAALVLVGVLATTFLRGSGERQQAA